MPSSAALEILGAGARALARDDRPEPTLLAVLQPLADQLGIGSAAVFVTEGQTERLEIAASIGLGDPSALAVAVRNPAHPIARTLAERSAAFDVRPMTPGGPALRSHLPLIVGAGDGGVIVGVLALAHDRPTGPDERAILAAVADLAAVAVQRDQARRRPA